ncbi:MAG: tyrosine-type recombinase/integrase [Bacteroides sp.]|nr:tyrosine-type recombinase/integrase [Bacteroides sp.]
MRMKYPAYADNILRMFESATLCEATWENLTKVRLQAMINYMNERIAPNSVHQYCTKLKAVLNLYSEEVELPRDYAKVLTPKKCASTAIYLTEDELQLLIDYNPKNDKERYVRNVFILSSFTGARHSDSARFNSDNIIGDTLQYISVKTKTPTTIPLKPIVAEYIKTMPQITMGDKTFNANIRRIAQKCGINSRVKLFRAGEEYNGEKWEFLSSHDARRSFASNLYLRGVDIYSISRMLGHSSVNTTQLYIQASIRTNSEELMGYFR